MQLPVIQYKHHDCVVNVRTDLKGKHRQFCLCHQCLFFDAVHPTLNCNIANELLNLCKEHNIVTPVWECPKYVPR